MLDIKYIRENKDVVIKRLNIRGKDYTQEIENVIKLDEARRKIQQELDDVRHQVKVLSKKYKMAV